MSTIAVYIFFGIIFWFIPEILSAISGGKVRFDYLSNILFTVAGICGVYAYFNGGLICN
jgi:hypothetical protein